MREIEVLLNVAPRLQTLRPQAIRLCKQLDDFGGELLRGEEVDQ
ncbi:hypothetical protein [Accumulibacter sp.]|nr:hypothetical protein [Accumulibacter sp.]